MGESQLKHASNPTYLGVILDRTLSCKENGVQQLPHDAPQPWPFYSPAEYCALVWSRSSHTHQVDTQLNTTMQNITGSTRSTLLPWLPVLSSIHLLSWLKKACGITNTFILYKGANDRGICCCINNVLNMKMLLMWCKINVCKPKVVA